MALATCFATAVERHRSLPGDGLVRDPIFTSTHAITIDAPPQRVWPWIAQMGAGRGGWYSWDAIDNGGRPSATREVSELQTVVAGDIMPSVPGATDAFVVAAVDPPRDLVLTVLDGHGGYAVAWEHVLEPIAGGRTRLIVRGRASSRWLDLARAQPPAGHQRIFIERAYAVLAKLPRPLLIALAGFGHRIMEARHLRGIQRRSTASSDAGARLERWRRPLLACGILASLAYVATDLFASAQYAGYSFIDQTVSELFAIGAPTSRMVVPLFTLSSALLAVFGIGVWASAGRSRALRWLAIMLYADAANSLLLWNLFPIHMRGVAPTFTDAMHVVLAINPFVLLSIVFGVAAFKGWFRAYSAAMVLVLLVPAVLSFSYVGAAAANQPTPGMGLAERISQYGDQLWQATLAVVLLREADRVAGGNHRA